MTRKKKHYHKREPIIKQIQVSKEQLELISELSHEGNLCGFVRQPIHYYERTHYITGSCHQSDDFCLYADNPGHKNCKYKPQPIKTDNSLITHDNTWHRINCPYFWYIDFKRQNFFMQSKRYVYH